MGTYIPRRSRRLATLGFVVLCGAALLAYSRLGTARPVSEPMVFALSVQDGDGVLASPVVLGAAGQKVNVRMMCEQDPATERMHLTLNPLGAEDGQMLYSYELSVAGRVEAEHGTVKLAMGHERRIRIRSNTPGGVTLSLYAAPIRHPGVERYLQLRKARLTPASS